MFADNNLFNPAWTTGSLSAIAPIVQVVGFCAMCLISIGGFFMVILPLMRNVINGIVVVAPNICDKIDEAHRTKLGLQHQEGGNQIQMVLGSISMMVYSFFPNFKAMSDFEDGVRDPKSFMLRAIPMMCIYVFIGVFIFYGYPGQIADKFSKAATGVIDMALNNVDPIAWIEKIPTNMAKPDFATGNATDMHSKNIYNLSKSLYSTITSKFGDMTKDNRIEVSHQIETFVSEKLRELPQTYKEDNKWKMTVETRVMGYVPELNKEADWPKPAIDYDNNIHIFQFSGDVTSEFTIKVPGGTEGQNFMCILKFYELAEEKVNSDNVKNTLNLPDTAEYFTGWESTGVVVTLPDNKFSVKVGMKPIINGVTASEVKTANGIIQIIFKNTLQSALMDAHGTTEYLYVEDGIKQHTVSKVTSSGNSLLCTPDASDKFKPWTPGGSPVAIKPGAASPAPSPSN